MLSSIDDVHVSDMRCQITAVEVSLPKSWMHIACFLGVHGAG